MNILNEKSLKINSKIKINFEGGDLTSDAGLLLINEFTQKLKFNQRIKALFKTNDSAERKHKDDENLWQVIYQILAAYFEDDCADELRNEPVLTTILNKNALASQPTLSRFYKSNAFYVHIYSNKYDFKTRRIDKILL